MMRTVFVWISRAVGIVICLPYLMVAAVLAFLMLGDED